ncbi:MAG TPA: hypothetical protein VL361_29480 [Candidatus Limnocylindrales bacterium]|nr:hypothetical protein [Candidatus Limnocylindrales bacterium]
MISNLREASWSLAWDLVGLFEFLYDLENAVAAIDRGDEPGISEWEYT